MVKAEAGAYLAAVDGDARKAAEAAAATAARAKAEAECRAARERVAALKTRGAAARGDLERLMDEASLCNEARVDAKAAYAALAPPNPFASAFAPPDPVASLVPGSGQSARDCPECPEMVVVPAGSFMMGSPASETGRSSDEGPQRKVTIARPIAVGKFEVTFEEWAACVAGQGCASNKEPGDQGWGTGRRPVINVSWDHAKEYVAWLSRKTGKAYRLLTEAEWEYAARGVTSASARHTRFHFGDSDGALGEHAWFSGNSGSRTHEVGQKRPNAWGLHDMHGNVMEWVLDQYNEKGYAGREGVAENPLAIPTTLYPRVARGGSWYDPPEELRSARRIASNENWKVQDPQLPKSIWYHTDAHWLGFRIVRPLEIPETETMHQLWNLGTVDSN